MNETQLSPLAEMLIQSYLDTAGYSRLFRDEYGQPPTTLAKVHNLRSVAQVLIGRDDRFELDDAYIEFGRIQATDLRDGRTYLLRSESATAIELATRSNPMSNPMFDTAKYIQSDVTLLVHKFAKEGLDLSVAGTKRPAHRSRLQAAGPPTFIATWSYDTPPSGPPFAETRDAFDELGDIDSGEEPGEEAV